METYSMSQVEVLTGISAHKLRIWERRYDFLKPYRTPTNIRYYSDEQLKKLLNVAILNRNGIKISKIDKMSDTEIQEKAATLLTQVSADHEDEINTLILTMMNFDEGEFQAVFRRCIIRMGFLKTITDIIYPFLNQIGILWTSNKISPSQEHFISNLIRQKLIVAIDALPLAKQDAATLALVLLDKEDHDMGLLLSAYIAKNQGWRVVYLGQRVPRDDVESIVEQIRPNLIMSHFVAPLSDDQANRVVNTINESGTPWLISGAPKVTQQVLQADRTTLMSSPQEFIAYLSTMSE
jgi:DNA-binding transcriptional MerR regulator